MITYFNRFSKAASVAALTVGVAFAAMPAQKASAQSTQGRTGAIAQISEEL